MDRLLKLQNGETLEMGGGFAGSLGHISGMKNYPVILGDYFINHDIRIPIKQPGCLMESKGPRVFFRGSFGFPHHFRIPAVTFRERHGSRWVCLYIYRTELVLLTFYQVLISIRIQNNYTPVN